MKHLVRAFIRLVRRFVLGPRLAQLADLSQGEIVNLIESASGAYVKGSPAPHELSDHGNLDSSKELAALKELCAQLTERIQVLERANA
jgi:hypothetical protein